LFIIKQGEEESLEDYLDIFLFIHKRVGTSIEKEFEKTILFRVLTYSSLDVLNVMGKGNISTLALDDIMELCRNYSRIRNSS